MRALWTGAALLALAHAADAAGMDSRAGQARPAAAPMDLAGRGYRPASSGEGYGPAAYRPDGRGYGHGRRHPRFGGFGWPYGYGFGSPYNGYGGYAEPTYGDMEDGYESAPSYSRLEPQGPAGYAGEYAPPPPYAPRLPSRRYDGLGQGVYAFGYPGYAQTPSLDTSAPAYYLPACRC